MGRSYSAANNRRICLHAQQQRDLRQWERRQMELQQARQQGQVAAQERQTQRAHYLTHQTPITYAPITHERA